ENDAAAERGDDVEALTTPRRPLQHDGVVRPVEAEVGVGLRPERPRPRVIEEEEALRARADEEPSRMREHAVDRLPGELLPPRYRHEAVPLQPLQSHV